MKVILLKLCEEDDYYKSNEETELLYVKDEFIDQIRPLYDDFDHYWMYIHNGLDDPKGLTVQEAERLLDELGEELTETEIKHFDAFHEIDNWNLGNFITLFQTIYPDSVPEEKLAPSDVHIDMTMEFSW